MSVGLIGLLDDIAGIAKVAAASLDDVAGMAMKAGLKASGAVIDDAAVTPKYLTGFSADRELPIVAKIAQEQADLSAPGSVGPERLPAVGDYSAADAGRSISLL